MIYAVSGLVPFEIEVLFDVCGFVVNISDNLAIGF